VDQELIFATHDRLKSPFKVARELNMDPAAVLIILDGRKASRGVRREERFEGWGPPGMRCYVVARKAVCESWDNTSPEIAKARDDYERGTHYLATGRDGDWLLLYAIPLKRLDPKPGYFSRQGPTYG